MAKKEEMEEVEKTIEKVLKYSKNELITSDKYLKRKDILKVLLDENKQYSLEEVDKILEKFMKGKV